MPNEIATGPRTETRTYDGMCRRMQTAASTYMFGCGLFQDGRWTLSLNLRGTVTLLMA